MHNIYTITQYIYNFVYQLNIIYAQSNLIFDDLWAFSIV